MDGDGGETQNPVTCALLMRCLPAKSDLDEMGHLDRYAVAWLAKGKNTMPLVLLFTSRTQIF